jgi:hypothetical protein
MACRLPRVRAVFCSRLRQHQDLEVSLNEAGCKSLESSFATQSQKQTEDNSKAGIARLGVNAVYLLTF